MPARSEVLSGDIVPPETRSAIMRAVGQRGTRPERAVQALLKAEGVRYRLNHQGLPGRPDFANRQRGWAIFVHGCFWHGHRNCRKTKGGKRGRIPVTRSEYWAAKLDANRARDQRKVRENKALGLRVLTVWECELANTARVSAKLSRFLDATR